MIRSWELSIKSLLSISKPAAFAVFLSGTANAAEISYTVAINPDEQLTGTVFLYDSSGDVQSVRGTASGVVNGTYTLDSINTHAEMYGTALELNVIFERADQRLSARLDTCPASRESCSPGSLVILWEK